eukprot:6478352-Amphidinium_carterae.1
MPCPLMLSKVSCRWDNRRGANDGCFKRHWTRSANTSMASSKPRLLKVRLDEVLVDVQGITIDLGIVDAGVAEVDVEIDVEIGVEVDVEVGVKDVEKLELVLVDVRGDAVELGIVETSVVESMLKLMSSMLGN